MIWIPVWAICAFFTFKNILWDGSFPAFGSEPRNFLEWFFAISVSVFLSGILAGAAVAGAALVGSIPEKHSVLGASYPLVALRQQDGVRGTFFLGSGQVNDEQYYFWYRRNNDRSVSGGKTYREPGVRIFETDEENPRMVTWKSEYVNPRVTAWLIFFGMDMRPDTHYCPDFYIPKGAIKEGYSL